MAEEYAVISARNGLAAGLGKRLNWPDPLNFTLYGEAELRNASLKNWNTSVTLPTALANLASLKFVFARNSWDQADLSAPRFGVQRIGAVHALLALGRQKTTKMAELANDTDSKWPRTN